MKKYEFLKGIFLVVAVLVSSSSFGDQRNAPETVIVPPQNVFIPTGFDDNDQSQIVFEGMLPNSCFKSGSVKTFINRERKLITIQNEALYYPSDWCVHMLVPYSHVVELGVLPTGKYRVQISQREGSPRKITGFKVAKSKSDRSDDYLYASVESVTTDYNEETETVSAVLSGVYTNTCMEIKEVRVIHKNSQIVEILPIMEFKSNTICADQMVPFEKSVELPRNLKKAVLIHVRSLNGKSVNLIRRF